VGERTFLKGFPSKVGVIVRGLIVKRMEVAALWIDYSSRWAESVSYVRKRAIERKGIQALVSKLLLRLPDDPLIPLHIYPMMSNA
jgi:hypothetical protein